jgi:DNA-directed RNA polymerase specialized sigma24 family protein
MTFLALHPYLSILIHARAGSPSEFNDALDYVADTLLHAGRHLPWHRHWRAIPVAGSVESPCEGAGN